MTRSQVTARTFKSMGLARDEMGNALSAEGYVFNKSKWTWAKGGESLRISVERVVGGYQAGTVGA